MRTRSFAFLCASLAGFAATPGEGQDHWTGWLYFPSGDVPIRMHVFGPDTGEPVAHVDLPASGQIGVRFDSLELSEVALELRHKDLVTLSGTRSNGHVEGSVDWYGERGHFELHSSAVPLDWLAAVDAEPWVGIYRDGAGGLLVLSLSGWGELKATDLQTGRIGILFPTGRDSVVLGPGFYVVDRVDLELRALRTPEGAIDALLVIAPNDPAGTRFERVALRESVLEIERASARLEGVAVRIDDDVERPAVVLAGGSNWTTRKGLIERARILAALGLVAVAYDKRGHGASTGEKVVPFAETGEDLVAWIGALRRRPGVRPDRVGVYGISRGGWYGAHAAAHPDGADFFVSEVGASVTVATQETDARLEHLRRTGASHDVLDEATEYLRLLWEFARTGEGADGYLAARARMQELGILEHVQGPAEIDDGTWLWSRLNAHVDPAPWLAQVRGPILAIYGSEDVPVNAWANASRLRTIRRPVQGGRLAIRVLQGADHSLHSVLHDEQGRELRMHARPGLHPDAWAVVRSWLADEVLELR